MSVWAVPRFGMTELYHIAHITNLPGILRHGLLSHSEVQKLEYQCCDISNQEVQNLRDRREPLYGRPLHSYVPLYIKPKNPMLYVKKEMQPQLCILEIKLNVLNDMIFLFTDGNAASLDTTFYKDIMELNKLPWDAIKSEYWKDFPDGKRKKCAEFLIYPNIPTTYINRLHFSNKAAANESMALVKGSRITTRFSPTLFFEARK